MPLNEYLQRSDFEVMKYLVQGKSLEKIFRLMGNDQRVWQATLTRLFSEFETDSLESLRTILTAEKASETNEKSSEKNQTRRVVVFPEVAPLLLELVMTNKNYSEISQELDITWVQAVALVTELVQYFGEKNTSTLKKNLSAQAVYQGAEFPEKPHQTLKVYPERLPALDTPANITEIRIYNDDEPNLNLLNQIPEQDRCMMAELLRAYAIANSPQELKTEVGKVLTKFDLKDVPRELLKRVIPIQHHLPKVITEVAREHRFQLYTISTASEEKQVV